VSLENFPATTTPAEISSRQAIRAVAITAAIYAIVGGVVTLVGWAADVQRLTDWNNDGISMFPNTAICAAWGGIALLLLAGSSNKPARHNAARGLAVLVALVGGLTLLEHLSGLDFGIDTLLVNRPWGQRASAAPMRMGPPASTSFFVLGAGLLLATTGPRGRRFASALALLVVSIVSLSLTGYLFGADQLFVVARFTGIALQTSTMLAALGIGLIAAIPEHGLAAILRRDDAGGLIVRRLMLPIFAVPLLLGWLRVRGQDVGLYDTAFGTSMLVLSMIAILIALLWWTADGISRQAQLARAAERAVRESEERFRIMADAAPVLMWISGADKLCTWFNKQWLEFVGRTMEQVVGNGWVDNVHPDDAERCLGSYVAAFDARQPFSMEYRIRRHDGQYRWVLDRGIPRYESDGEFAGYIGSCVEITERKRIEESAKEADRRKDEFLATLAHELRNPLAPIGNALEIIKHVEGDRDLLQQARDTMERQFGQMVRLVDDLLDIGRITRDKLELRTQRVELAPVVQQAVETCRSLAEKGQLALSVSLPRAPVWLHGDPVRLTQVFCNLLNNACKFTEPGGAISIVANRQDADVVVSVKDSGIGIQPDKLETIFEMFQQVDKTLERTRGGLGIGLTLVRRLVELHGGQVIARSLGSDRGSEFSVRLPALDDTDGAPPTTQPSGADRAMPRRVLVTDDNRDAADSLAMLLRLGGHSVQTAYDGIDAVQKARAGSPDVLLLDIGLPGMNGYEVCRAIRREPWGKRMRIVALTGWGQDQDRHKTRQAGFDHHLVKPVNPDSLAGVLADFSPDECVTEPAAGSQSA
jgi:PAS domain S-box-containing protein